MDARHFPAHTLQQLIGLGLRDIAAHHLQHRVADMLEGDDNPGLYRMNADGTQVEYIASGDLTNIHCTSQYTFFQYFDNQGVLYRVPTMGAISYPEEIRIQKES